MIWNYISRGLDTRNEYGQKNERCDKIIYNRGDFMLLENQDELERVLKKIIVRVVKLYKGKGPDYINIKMNNDKIEMFAKGVLSPLGKFLIEYNGIEEIEFIKNQAQGIVDQYMFDEIFKETNLRSEIIYDEYNCIEDFRKVVLKIKI